MPGKKKKSPVAKPISLQALEQRYLLDAAALTTLADAAADFAVDNEVNSALQQLSTYGGVSNAEQGDGYGPPKFLDVGSQSQTTEIVFIDRSVPNVNDLIGGITPTASVYFIGSESDGVEQINEVLANYSEVDAIHIISHGDQNRLSLGSSELNSDTMSGIYAEELADIGDALAEHGDILIYGCDFASGEDCLLYTSPSPRDS